MTEAPRPPGEQDEKPRVPASSSDPATTPAPGGAERVGAPGDAEGVGAPGWDGPTYYGRSQLKPAPFNNWAVGGYVFLAGLSGASALLAAIADGRGGAPALTRRGRFLSVVAPILGAPLLVWDLHTPQRFINMLRVAKRTSPMSIGTWILMAFSGAAGLTAGAQLLSDRRPGLRWPRRVARLAQVPAALTGAGLCTYTAALLAATSTPLWAAAPRALATRFGASSVASGASALALAERSPAICRQLDTLACLALLVELTATSVSHRRYERVGVGAALRSGWGRVERLGATGLGMVVPLALHAATTLTDGARAGTAPGLARLLTIGGSALLRIAIMGAGDVSASRPDISMRFAQPANLPARARKAAREGRRAARTARRNAELPTRNRPGVA